jgi:hypothetical protein
MQEKELLRKLGEETLHSAKGHFKACDLRRNLITYTLWSCVLFSVLDVMNIWPIMETWFDGLGIFGMLGLLIWNEGEGKNYRTKHKEAAEKYLALHKEIRKYFYLNDIDKQKIEELSKTVSQFDQSEKPEIPNFAKWLAKKAIEGKDPETDNWFKKD